MIREVTGADAPSVLEVAASCGLFEPEELETLDAQLQRSLSGRGDRPDLWLASFDDRRSAAAVAFCAQEAMADRVWNLLFIGVRAELQGSGLGGALLAEVEARLRGEGQRMLLIETTNGPEFEGTQAFYRKKGYEEEGTVRDFYAQGAHKLAFRKLL